jgi:hypothetical protein
VGPDGRVQWSEGSSNVRESIQIILTTERRERVMLAGFGGSLGQFLFEPNTVATRNQIAERIRQALAQWEPRITVESVSVEEDPRDARAALVTLTYKLVASGALERVNLSVTLGG